MFKHSGSPAAVIYILGQNWLTCRASHGATNTPYPRHHCHSDAIADRYEYQPCADVGSDYLSYPSSGLPRTKRLTPRCSALGTARADFKGCRLTGPIL